MKRYLEYEGVLVLAGVELTFFTVASIGLCFGFVMNTGVIIDVSDIADQDLHRA